MNQSVSDKNRRLAWKMSLVVLGAFAFAFAMVPLYDRICRALGITSPNGPTPMPAVVSSATEGRPVEMEFSSTVMPDLPVQITPEKSSMSVTPGKTYSTFYKARNMTSSDLVIRALPSIAPTEVTQFLHKVQCFCFELQPLKPGETRNMSLVFVVSPDMPKKHETLTLSYTFFDAKSPS